VLLKNQHFEASEALSLDFLAFTTSFLVRFFPKPP